MKNSTHYLFSLGIANLYLAVEQDHDFLILGFSIFLSILCSLFSVLPNYIDKKVSIDMGIQIPRPRHPLSHSPWTIMYFLPFLYLSEVIDVKFFKIIVSLISISWVSHLFLDLLNPGGIPIGKNAIFKNHPIKHYKFIINKKNGKCLHLANIPFNDSKVNRNLSYIGLFLFSLNLTTMFLTLFRGD